MNKKFNIIKLSGFKGLFLIVFLAGCLITGFLVFPGWVCMHLWNFTASYFNSLPVMNLVHGVILWCILALSGYALNKNNLSISFDSVSPNEERLKRIIAEESKEIVIGTNENSSEEKDKLTK